MNEMEESINFSRKENVSDNTPSTSTMSISTSKPIPIILNSEFFEVIGEISTDLKVKARCLLCKKKSKDKDNIISGSLLATSNFRLHIKVSLAQIY